MKFYATSIFNIFLTIIFSSLLFKTPIATAVNFKHDHRYVYQIIPYTEALKGEGYSSIIIDATLAVFQDFLAELHRDELIPTEILSFEDIQQITEANKDIDEALDNLNSWVEVAQSTAPFLFESADLIPDAFIIFGGTKLSKNILAGFGGSLTLGLIVMPAWVNKVDKLTNEVVDSYLSAQVSLVGWASPDIGVGVGGGIRGRLGFGLIWNPTGQFTTPSQFVGFGLGLSQSVVMGPAGINLKAGVLNNVSMPNWIDFIYATTAWDFGLAATAEMHVNGTVILPISAIFDAFDSSSRSIINERTQDLEKRIHRALQKRVDPQMVENSDEAVPSVSEILEMTLD